MRKEFYLKKSAARVAAVIFASENNGIIRGYKTCDDRTKFDYEDDEAGRLSWSGQVNAILVVSAETGEEIGAFAYWDEELWLYGNYKKNIVKKDQLKELREYDASSMLLKAVVRHYWKVFDKWMGENHPGEVFDDKQLELIGDIHFTTVKYKGRTALEMRSEDCLRFKFRSSIFGDKID